MLPVQFAENEERIQKEFLCSCGIQLLQKLNIKLLVVTLKMLDLKCRH